MAKLPFNISLTPVSKGPSHVQDKAYLFCVVIDGECTKFDHSYAKSSSFLQNCWIYKIEKALEFA